MGGDAPEGAGRSSFFGPIPPAVFSSGSTSSPSPPFMRVSLGGSGNRIIESLVQGKADILVHGQLGPFRESYRFEEKKCILSVLPFPLVTWISHCITEENLYGSCVMHKGPVDVTRVSSYAVLVRKDAVTATAKNT